MKATNPICCCNHTKTSLSNSSIRQVVPKGLAKQEQNMIKQINKNSFSDSASSNDKEKNIIEITKNTNLICSFLKTFSPNIPIEDDNDKGHMKKVLNKTMNNNLCYNNKFENKSLEHFMIIILTNIIFNEVFIYVSLFFIYKYINIKSKMDEAQKMDEYNKLLRKQKYSIHNTSCTKIKKNSITKVNSSQNESYKKFIYNNMNLKNFDAKINMRKKNLRMKKQQMNSSINNENNDNNNNNNNNNNNSNNNNNNNDLYGSTTLSKFKMIHTQKDLILASMICASKYLDDNSYNNIAWHKLTKRNINDIFELEREFLITIDYQLYFSNEEWNEWIEWIENYKFLLESREDITINENIFSQNDVTVSSQSCCDIQDIMNNNDNDHEFVYKNDTSNKYHLPSPFSVQNTLTKTSTTFQIPFTFNKEKLKKNNSTINQNKYVYLPSLPSKIPFSSSIENHYPLYSTITPQQLISLPYENYLYYNREENISQCPPLNNSSNFMMNDNKYNSQKENEIKQNGLMSGTPYDQQNPFILPYSTLEKMHSQNSCNIDTTLFNQNDSIIDFSEIIQLYQKKNHTFKKPILPPI